MEDFKRKHNEGENRVKGVKGLVAKRPHSCPEVLQRRRQAWSGWVSGGAQAGLGDSSCRPVFQRRTGVCACTLAGLVASQDAAEVRCAGHLGRAEVRGADGPQSVWTWSSWSHLGLSRGKLGVGHTGALGESRWSPARSRAGQAVGR